MLKRVGGYLFACDAPAPAASAQLERDGYAVLRGVLAGEELATTRAAIAGVYESQPPSGRARVQDEDFRYEMFNKCALAQRLVAHRRILEVIEPLLGEDCHVIANTCWRNRADAEHRHGGGGWHIDAGPHIPRPPGTVWPDAIPYPVFAIGVRIFLDDCPIACGPTAVIPGSHKSAGRRPLSVAPHGAHLRRTGRVAADGLGGRCGAVRLRRVAPACAGRGRRRRQVLPASALRQTRHRPAREAHRRGEPLGRSRRSAARGRAREALVRPASERFLRWVRRALPYPTWKWR